MKKLVLFLFFLHGYVFAQSEIQWNGWELSQQDPRSWKLAYLKLAHELPSSPTKDFLTYENFSATLSALKSEEAFPKTFGDLRQFFLKEPVPPSEATFMLTPEQHAQALVQELSFWKDKLNSSEMPSGTIRSAMAIAYCKTLGEQVVQTFLRESGNYNLRRDILLPLATLLKSDAAWYIRHDLLTPIFMYQLFQGSHFELDLLDIMVSDPDYRVRLRLLNLFERSNFSYTLLRSALLQIIEEDSHSGVKEKAQALLRSLAQRQTDMDGGPEGVLFAAPAAASPLEEEPKTSRKIRGSTRRFRKPTDILTKILDLQKEVAPKDIPLSETDPKLIPFLQDLLFSKEQPLYVRISALELLFYYEDQMMPILKEALLSDQVPDEIKLQILNTIKKGVTTELVPAIQAIAYGETGKPSATVRLIALTTLTRYRETHPPSLSSALDRSQERLELIARAREIYQKIPDHFAERVVRQMENKEWTPIHILEVMRRTRRHYFPNELPAQRREWFEALHKAGILKKIFELEDASFEKLRPLIIQALEKDIRRPK